jgi:hypothetical protein
MAGTASNNGTVIPCNGFAVILRCAPLRASAETTMLILLLGQITRYCVQPLLQKYFVLRLTQLSCLILASRPERGGVGHRH